MLYRQKKTNTFMIFFIVLGSVGGWILTLQAGGKHEHNRHGTDAPLIRKAPHVHLIHVHKKTNTYWSGERESESFEAKVVFEEKKAHESTIAYGVWKNWWKNGKPKSETHYCSMKQVHHRVCLPGQRQGISRSWFRSGRLKKESTYHQDLLHGKVSEWYQAGAVKRQRHFYAGQLSGPYLVKWWNASKAEEGHYLNGKKVGEWKYWYANGKLKQLETYKIGMLDGPWQQWWWICRDRGCEHLKVEEGFYSRGKKDGQWRRWSVSQRVEGVPSTYRAERKE